MAAGYMWIWYWATAARVYLSGNLMIFRLEDTMMSCTSWKASIACFFGLDDWVDGNLERLLPDSGYTVELYQDATLA